MAFVTLGFGAAFFFAAGFFLAAGMALEGVQVVGGSERGWLWLLLRQHRRWMRSSPQAEDWLGGANAGWWRLLFC